MRRQKREQQRRYRAKKSPKTKQKTKNKQTKKTSASYKTMNEKLKVIQKANENRKAVIRTQRWKLRIKLQKDNTDKQPTVPEESTYNSRFKYDREKKEQQSVLQLVSQPSKSWESKDVVFQKMKQKIDEHISSNRLLYYLNSSLKSY